MRLALVVFSLLTLVACSSPSSQQPAPVTSPTEPDSPANEPTTPEQPETPDEAEAPSEEPAADETLSSAEAYTLSLNLWRNDDLSKHPKGSCAGCHGPDFIDLARIGASDLDLTRRALIDGASDLEARALVQAVNDMRLSYDMPAETAREFRPFQPGGEVLLPGLNDAPHVVAVKRDIAFAQQLKPLLPTLYGERIDSLADAKQAQAELLDLAEGSNLAGANSERVQLRELPTGISYPLWSADLHHGPDEGTFNDWIADIAHDAKPEQRDNWLALQDTYLSDSTTLNFWKMYAAAGDMTQVPLLGECTATGINTHLACGAVDDFNRDKFLSALMGQHMLRQTLRGEDDFARGAIAFSYLDTEPEYAFMRERSNPAYLPANMWEIGDRGRVMLNSSSETGSFRVNLSELGYPEFAQNSIDAARTESEEQHALQLAWFWVGFTFDPSFARIHPSNATKVGEYMVATLINENMFVHNSFQAHMRLVTKGTLQDANMEYKYKYQPATPEFKMNYNYFVGYNRTMLRWKENKKASRTVPQALKDEQAKLWHTMTANGFRMSLYLYAEALDSGVTPDPKTPLEPLRVHFATYQPQHQADDEALLNSVETRLD